LIKIILDTNVLLSALLSPVGPPAQLLEAWERKKFIVVACEALIAELRDVTSRPFFQARLRVSTVELLAAGLRDLSEFCADLPQEVVAPDAKDSFLLALAEAAHADFLVTGDKELLALKHHGSTRIITPVAILQILKSGQGE
jgi:putative PIN family toxin of toxin-antitoxin system